MSINLRSNCNWTQTLWFIYKFSCISSAKLISSHSESGISKKTRKKTMTVERLGYYLRCLDFLSFLFWCRIRVQDTKLIWKVSKINDEKIVKQNPLLIWLSHDKKERKSSVLLVLIKIKLPATHLLYNKHIQFRPNHSCEEIDGSNNISVLGAN